MMRFNFLLCALVAASSHGGVVMATECTADLDDIVQAEMMVGNKEETSMRTYTLCADTEFTHPPSAYELEVGPNVVIRCGTDGLPTNNCELVDVRIALRGDNAVLRGLTFQFREESANGIVLISEPGVFALEDCIFKDWIYRNQEIFFNTAGGSGLATLNINRCQFLNTGVAVEAARPNNNIIIRDTIFEGNQYGAYGIINANGENNMMKIENSCFFFPTSRGNIARAQNGARVSGTNNFGVFNENAGRSAADCTFVAMYPRKETDGGIPECLDFDATVCAVTGGTASPNAGGDTTSRPPEGTEQTVGGTTTMTTIAAASSGSTTANPGASTSNSSNAPFRSGHWMSSYGGAMFGLWWLAPTLLI